METFLEDYIWPIVIGFAVLVVATALYLGYYKTFAPAFNDAQRDAYEHSQSYVEGAVRDLNNLCIEISNSDANHKKLLQDTIRHRFAKLDSSDVPNYLKNCLDEARKGQN